MGRRPATAALLVGALLLGGCATSGTAGSAGRGNPRDRVIQAVAAENFWGSIASQLGGRHVHVTSLVTNPNTDPHSYDPTPADARALAEAGFVIENGAGYDPWAAKLLSADGGDPTVLDVGHLLGLPDGANPHRWYDPADVRTVISRIVADYRRLDPEDGSYFSQEARTFNSVALAGYHAAIAAIRARYAGTPVGASESIFAVLAPALGLDLVTPYRFLRAVSEGTDVSAADKQAIDAQIRTHRIKIYVYNSQNVTPDVRAQIEEVKAAHIPTATITETLSPPGASYQTWQTRQLLGIQRALARAATPT